MTRPPVTAVLLAAGLAVLGVAQSVAEQRPVGATAVVVAGTAAVLLVQTPLVLAAAAALSVAAQAALVGEPAFASFLLVLVSAYALGRRCQVLRLGLGLGLLASGIAAVVAADASLRSAGELVYPVVYVGGAAGLGRLVRSREEAGARALVALAATAQARQREVLAQERACIAREMHDVVAHSVSLLVVQAESAAAVLDRDPARAREQLERISASGRQALEELRRVLGLLRTDDEPAGAHPQPGLADLHRLDADAAGAGLTVRLRVDDALDDLAPGVQLTVFRIVQEALTNAVRHGHADCAEVEVSRCDDLLTVGVSDDGAGAPAGWTPGHGLHGMHERVRLYDGELDAGPGPRGGFRVQARIPGQR